MRQKRRRMNIKLKMALTFLLVLCLCTGIGVMFTPLFHVNEVLCEGVVRIPAEEIFASAGEVKGKNILLVSLSDIEKRVEEIPMVEHAKVRRVFPNKIKIIIEECIPAGYLYSNDQCVVADLEGKVLEIISDGRVNAMLATYTPKEPPKMEQASNEGEEPTATPTPTTIPTVEEDEMGMQAGEEIELRAYSVPLVLGVELQKPEVGKKVDSKDKEVLDRAFAIFRDLERAGLLARATYLDVRDWEDVTLVIENRLEIQLGKPDNMEYRSAFLAKVIEEKMSSTEHAIMDYRKSDIYVRQPEDGMERVKPNGTPTPSPSAKPVKSSTSKATPKPAATAGTATVLDMDEE